MDRTNGDARCRKLIFSDESARQAQRTDQETIPFENCCNKSLFLLYNRRHPASPNEDEIDAKLLGVEKLFPSVH